MFHSDILSNGNFGMVNFLKNNNLISSIKINIFRENRIAFFLLFLGVFSGFLLVNADAKDEKVIRINDINAELNGKHLVVSARCEHLFSEKTISTIQSGLPTLVQFEIRLLESNQTEQLFKSNKTILNLPLARTITYDLWNEKYVYKTEDSTYYLSDLEKVKAVASTITQKQLIEASKLNSGEEYSVEIRVQIVPISAEQSAKIATWLETSQHDVPMMTADETSSNFTFSVEKLVSLFVGQKNRTHNSSDWYRSESFNLSNQEK